MSKKVVKKILSKAKKEIKTKKPSLKVKMTEEPVSKKKKNSQKILTAEGWKRRMRKTVVKKS